MFNKCLLNNALNVAFLFLQKVMTDYFSVKIKKYMFRSFLLLMKNLF